MRASSERSEGSNMNNFFNPDTITPGAPIPAFAFSCVRDVVLADMLLGGAKAEFLKHVQTSSTPGAQVQVLAVRRILIEYVTMLNDQNDTLPPMKAANTLLWPVLIRVKDLSDKDNVAEFVGDYYTSTFVLYDIK